MHIGVLEDNGPIAELLTFTLESAGYTVGSHPCGSSFLNALFPGSTMASLYDLAIIDLGLPDISGMDVLTAIRQDHAVPAEQLPIIVLSGAADHEIARVEADFPTTLVLRKPYCRRDLLQAIATLLEERCKQ